MNNIVILTDNGDLSNNDLSTKIQELTGLKFDSSSLFGTIKPRVEKPSGEKTGSTNDGLVDPEESGICLKIGGSDGWKINNGSITLKVVSASYEKRVYQPGEFCVVFSVTTDANRGEIISSLKTELTDTDGNNKVLKTIIHLLGLYEVDKNTKDVFSICKHYYVHDFEVFSDVKVEWDNGVKVEKKATYVRMNCFSPDKLLTLDKYSKAYSGVTFDKELFKDMAVKPELRDDKEKLCELDYKTSYMVNTYYEEGDSSKDISFPYLVQYNESYYDFLKRIAARCGEFLYHEDGKLTLGLSDKKKPGSTTNLDNVDVIYPKVSIVESNVEVTPYSGTCLGAEDTKSTDYPYNAEYSVDDNQRIMSKDYNETLYKKLLAWEKFAYASASSMFTKGESIEAALTSSLATLFAAAADAGVNKAMFEDDFEDEIKEYCKNVGINKLQDTTNKIFANNLLNTNFYNYEQNAKWAESNTVVLDYQDKTPTLKLGTPVNLNDGVADFYIVTRVSGTFKPNDENKLIISNNAEIVPVRTISTSDGNSKTIIAPPHYNIPRIRNSETQEAVVMDTKDILLLGRVRVKFLWQNDKVLSPWIRVASPYSGGKSGGMIMTPEIGDHLMVNFIDGNVECPYVGGYVPTQSTMPAFGGGLLKDKFSPKYNRKVISSAKGHAITFIDKTDRSSVLNMVCPPVSMFINMYQGIAKQCHGKTDDLGIDETIAPFTGGINLRDPNGVYELDLSAKNRAISINSPFGTVSISAFTGITIDAPNGDVKIRGKNVSIEAGNNVSIVSGQNIRDKKFGFGTGFVTGSLSLVNVLTTIAGKSITAAAPWMGELTKIADVSFLRSSWEIFIRPVEGTLRLKSKRNTLITAGKGNAVIPKDCMSKAKAITIENYLKPGSQSNQYLNCTRNQKVENLILEFCNIINASVDSAKTAMININNSLESLKVKLNTINGFLTTAGKHAFNTENGNEINKGTVKSILNENIPEFNAEYTDGHAYDKMIKRFIDDLKDVKDNINNINPPIDNVIKNLKKTANKSIYAQLKLNLANINENNSIFINDIFGANKVTEGNNDYYQDLPDDNRKKIFCRKVAYKILDELGFYNPLLVEEDNDAAVLLNNNIVSIDELNQDISWTRFIDGISANKTAEDKYLPLKSMVDKLSQGFTNFTTYGLSLKGLICGGYSRLVNADGISGPRSIWDVTSKGKVLISNSPSVTMNLKDDSSGWESLSNANIENIKATLQGDKFMHH